MQASPQASPLVKTWSDVEYAEHQDAGIRWMLFQEITGYQVTDKITVRGGILGDEMGLGKTIQALGLIVNNPVKRTLIITPLAVRKQWEDAARRCNVNVFTAEKATWKKHGRILHNRPDVYIGHYDRVVSDLSLFKEVTWSRIILDEAQRIRNSNTATGLKISKLVADSKWCLTATPIVNTLKDAVSYLRFLGFPVDDSGNWRCQYESWVRNCFMARSLGECSPPAGLCMPTEPIVNICDLEFNNKEENTIYNNVYDNLEAQWRHAKALNGQSYQLAKLSILLRLRQISVSPQIYINARKKEAFGWNGPDFNLPSRKFDEISHLLREGSVESHGWIIFCQFHDEMELLSNYLKAFDFIGAVRSYHGGMTLAEREAIIQDSKTFSSGTKQDVLLVQLQAGGTGLNLQHYDRVIFTSSWWTSALLDQALGRVQRIGQKNQVLVYWLRLKIDSTFNIDQFIMEKANTKRDLGQIFMSWSVHS